MLHDTVLACKAQVCRHLQGLDLTDTIVLLNKLIMILFCACNNGSKYSNLHVQSVLDLALA